MNHAFDNSIKKVQKRSLPVTPKECFEVLSTSSVSSEETLGYRDRKFPALMGIPKSKGQDSIN